MKKVFVNGTFDILHPGHLALLNHARAQGDFLLVGLDTDERVRNLKPGRPINSQEYRRYMLENLRAVDQVVLFHTDHELRSYIQTCDLMVKGSDYRDQPVIGSDIVPIIFYERTPHSTTKIIQNIIDRR